MLVPTGLIAPAARLGCRVRRDPPGGGDNAPGRHLLARAQDAKRQDRSEDDLASLERLGVTGAGAQFHTADPQDRSKRLGVVPIAVEL